MKQEKGITLIALVITIIVLLILAGVMIAMIGSDGIPGKAQQASRASSFSDARSGVSNDAAAKLASYYDLVYAAGAGKTTNDITATDTNAGTYVLTRLTKTDNAYASNLTLGVWASGTTAAQVRAGSATAATSVPANGSVVISLKHTDGGVWLGTLNDKGSITWNQTEEPKS